MTGCPTEPIIDQFLSEQLADDDFHRVAEHIDGCRVCQAKLESQARHACTDNWRDLKQAAPRAESLSDTTKNYETSSWQSRRPSASEERPLPSLPGHEILSILGRGGMGVVYKARHIRLDRLVAVKMILAAEHASPELLDRFFTEARAVARLDHPNILHIYEIGDHEGNPFFSMEYVEGGTLAKTLSDELVEPKKAAQLTKTLAEAMHHAHQAGIVHRDLKPANVLLADNETAKIADFGLAKELQADSGQTQTGAILGTPSYMAFEQAVGDNKKVGPCTDVYALGAILYEMLAGRPPFKAASVLETLEQVRRQEPVAPRQLQPKVDRELETICLKCLQKKPEKRYGDAQALADDLDRFLKQEPILARPVGSAERIVKWVKRRPAIASFVAATFLLLLSVAVGAVVYIVETERYNTELASSKSNLEESNKQLTKSNEELTRATEKAKTNEAIAKNATKQKDEALNRAQLEIAKRDRNRGLRLCEEGDVNLGLNYLARSLKVAPPQAENIRRSSLVNIAAWKDRAYSHFAVCNLSGTAVTAVAYSPDGKTVLTGSNGMAQFWNASTGKEIGPSLRHGGIIECVAFSPDGKSVVTCSSDNTAQVWDAKSRKPKLHPLRHKGYVFSAAFSPDGKTILTGSTDKTAQLWDAATGGRIGPVLPHEYSVTAVAFNPDGKTVATGGSGVRLWNVETGQEIGTPLRPLGRIYSVAFSPDGKTVLAGSGSGTAEFWDVALGKPIGTPLYHLGYVYAVAFSPDGKAVLTGSGDGTARLWDVGTRKQIGSPLRHLNIVKSIAFSPDGKAVLTGSSDGTARLWNVAIREPFRPPLSHNPLLSGAGSVAFSPDGKTVLTLSSGSNSVELRNGATGKAIHVFRLEKNDIFNCAAFSADGKTVFASITRFPSKKYYTQMWDVAAKKLMPIGPPMHHKQGVCCIAYSPDGRFRLTGNPSGTVEFWDAATRKPDGQPLQQHGGIASIAVSPDGKSVLVGGARDNTARLWDVATRKPAGKPLQHQALVKSVAFSPDGKTLLTGSFDNTARLWEFSTGKPFGPPLPHKGKVNSVAFSPDGKTVVTGSEDNTVRFWDAATGIPIGLPIQHTGPVGAVACSPDNSAVLSFGGNTLKWTRIPQALPDNTDQVCLRVQALTGLTLLDDDEVIVLDGAAHADVLQKARSHNLIKILPPQHGSVPIVKSVAGFVDDYQRGLALYRQRKAMEAIKYFNRVLLADPKHVEAFCYRGQCNEMLRQDTNAIEDFTKAISLDPKNHRSYQYRGAIYYRLQQWESCITDWQRVMDSNPGWLRLGNALAHLYVSGPMEIRNPESALELALRINKLMPKTLRPDSKAGYLTTLGAAYYRTQQFDKALATLEKANKLEKRQSTEILLYLAMAYQQKKDATNAQRLLLQAKSQLNQGIFSRRLYAEAEMLINNP